MTNIPFLIFSNAAKLFKINIKCYIFIIASYILTAGSPRHSVVLCCRNRGKKRR